MVQSSAAGLSGRIAFALAGLGGLAQALSLAWPEQGQALGALQVLGLALLAWVFLHNPRARTVALWAWWFSTVHGVAATWWLYISMHQYGGLPAVWAVLAVLALQAALGLYLALALGLARALVGSRAGAGVQGLAFACACLLAELARAQWLTGFPWGVSGYAHVDSALAVLAPWLGVYGMGAVAALLAWCLAWAWGLRASLMRGGALVMSLATLLALSQPWRAADTTQELARVPLTLLQGNVPQDQKYQEQRLSAPRWYLEQLTQAGPGLILAPETAFALTTELWPAPWWQALRPPSAEQAVMIGAPWRSPQGSEYSNSVLAFAGTAPGTNAAGPDYRYDKHHLVPFGEFIPWGFAWFVQAMQIPLGEFVRGPSPQPAWTWAGLRWAPNICYEDLFGEELARLWSYPEGGPHVLLNFSNIAWFGDTIAQHQHLHMARLRTLELQRPMVRVTNTGVTVVIDHQGQVQARLPHWQRGVLQSEVSGRSGAATPYARWAGAWGLWPLWLLGLLGLGLAKRLARPTDRA